MYVTGKWTKCLKYTEEKDIDAKYKEVHDAVVREAASLVGKEE